MSLAECPVSFITGESAAAVEDFLASRMLGGDSDVRAWPARRVDAAAVLWTEVKKLERQERAES